MRERGCTFDQSAVSDANPVSAILSEVDPAHQLFQRDNKKEKARPIPSIAARK